MPPKIHRSRLSRRRLIGGAAGVGLALIAAPAIMRDRNSPIVATEFVGTSISSYGPPYELIAQTLPDNPHVHFFESRRRGYVLVELERAKMQVQMRVVSDAHDPKASIATLKTYAIESGHPGVVEA